MSRRGFYPGGSTQPNRDFDSDLECKDLHAFGNMVCNGEQRVGGKSIADTVDAVHVEVKDVASHGEMLVPVRGDAPGVEIPADHPGRGGLVMVNTSDVGKMYYSREDALYNTMKDAQDKHAGAVAARDAVAGVVTSGDDAADVTAAQNAIDALATGNEKYNEGIAAIRAGSVVTTNLATSNTNANTVVGTLDTAKTDAETNANNHGPFEWVAVN